MHTRAEHRRSVALAAEDILTGTMSLPQFMQMVNDADYEDPLLADLLDEIGHIPKRGGFLGLSAQKHDEWLTQTRRLIQRALASD
jgi:hypothetical protein